jgi:hypothetical protein
MAPRRPTEAGDALADLRRRWVAAVQDAAAPGASRAQRRQAANRRVYVERLLRSAERAQRRGTPVPSAREAAGHHRAGAAPARWTALVEVDPRAHRGAMLVGPGDVPSARDVSRVGRHWAAVAVLMEGGRWGGLVLTPERFRRLVLRWQPVTIGGERFRLASDAAAVMAGVAEAQAAGVELLQYEAGG